MSEQRPDQPDDPSTAPAAGSWVSPSRPPADASGEPSAPAPGRAPWQYQPPPPLPAYQPQPAAAPVSASSQPVRARLGVGSWLGICALALLLGVVGGVAGTLAVDGLRDDGPVSGTVGGGLAGVDTITEPPVRGNVKQQGGSISAVASAVLPSTVQIIAEYDGQARGATGSGFVLDKQGHVITNNHVVAEAASDDGPIEIVTQDGKRYDATVVGRSSVYDVAVLIAKDLAGQVQPASLGSSANLAVGDGVVAIGSPLGLTATVTSGIVSALGRPVTTGGQDDESYINAVQTDAAINPGNSGGPLVNLRGQVVGVNSAIATTGGSLGGEGGNIGVGFAIPVEQVKITADQILRTGEARYPVIGAQVRTGGGEGDGAQIVKVNDGSAAQEAGLEKGDRVITVDGTRVTDGISLIVSIRSHQPGETVTFGVVRDGEQVDVDVDLESEVG
ncbi:S1C family serine protease [Nocardioides acrostichi]|uniref:Trypsin-like peptidase domain-containing protein n=1 Tax=Nocardioides acrostichi TaxID=2784339 RepID=A0A930YDD3_9ACTN|nr:trypsin-like peptidase domain-containing protein [Nocardioides acrostichi]MBF4162369.1 trypsin-like peptidase domain-containing protein [Nocardioides acrostichi]